MGRPRTMLPGAAVVAAIALTGCAASGTGSAPPAQTSEAGSSTTVSPAQPTASDPPAPYDTQQFTPALTIDPPAWFSADPVLDEPHFLTWVGNGVDVDRAVRFLSPIGVYDPEAPDKQAGKLGPVPKNYVRHLLGLREYGAEFSDRATVEVDGHRATLMTAGTATSLSGTLGCQAEGLSPDDCLGLQPYALIRMAVIDDDGTTVLAWARTLPGSPTRDQDFAAFEEPHDAHVPVARRNFPRKLHSRATQFAVPTGILLSCTSSVPGLTAPGDVIGGTNRSASAARARCVGPRRHTARHAAPRRRHPLDRAADRLRAARARHRGLGLPARHGARPRPVHRARHRSGTVAGDLGGAGRRPGRVGAERDRDIRLGTSAGRVSAADGLGRGPGGAGLLWLPHCRWRTRCASPPPRPTWSRRCSPSNETATAPRGRHPRQPVGRARPGQRPAPRRRRRGRPRPACAPTR